VRLTITLPAVFVAFAAALLAQVGPSNPSPALVSPASGAGATQMFTFEYRDTAGAANLQTLIATARVTLSFKPSFAGDQQVWMFASELPKGAEVPLMLSWRQMGTWKSSGSASAINLLPADSRLHYVL
jgi:hypothetical protein